MILAALPIWNTQEWDSLTRLVYIGTNIKGSVFADNGEFAIWTRFDSNNIYQILSINLPLSILDGNIPVVGRHWYNLFKWKIVLNYCPYDAIFCSSQTYINNSWRNKKLVLLQNEIRLQASLFKEVILVALRVKRKYDGLFQTSYRLKWSLNIICCIFPPGNGCCSL